MRHALLTPAPGSIDAHALQSAPASFGLREFFDVMRRRILTFLGVWFGVALALFLLLMSQPRMYVGYATLALETTDRARVGENADSWTPPTDDSQLVDSEAGVVRSNSTILRVIQSKQLMSNPEFNEALAKPGLLARFFPQPPQSSTEAARAIETSKVVETVAEHLSARRIGRTRLIEITFKSRDPKLAAAVANAFGEEYIRANLDARRAASLEAAEWLRGRIGALRDEASTADRDVAEYRSDAGLLSADGVTLTERQISELQNQITLQRSELAEKQAQLAQLRAAARSGDDTLPAVLDSETIVDLRSQEAEVLRRLGELRQVYGPEWPDLVRAEQELRNLRDAIRDEVQRISTTIEREATIAQDRVARLTKGLDELRSQLASGGVAEVRLRDLERSASASRAVYESALARLQLDDLRSSYIEPQARLVSRATPPPRHSEPSGLLSALIALVIGLALASTLIAALEFFDRGFWSPRTLEDVTGVRHLAMIPSVSVGARTVAKPGKDVARALAPAAIHRAALDYSVDHPHSALSESLRRLRASVELAEGGRIRSLLITSPGMEEGKTFTAVGLARAGAMSGDRTLIIDTDLQGRGLSRAFGLNTDAGLIEVLQRRVDLTAALFRDDRTALFILPLSTTRHDDAMHLLEGRVFRNFMEALSKRFDLIVIDGAPILLSSQMQMVSSWADGVVLGLKWRVTTRGQTEASLDALARARANLLGCLLTKADISRGRFFQDGDSGAVMNRYVGYFQP
jgi:capsular exopolysaccharide synthesis family protein